MNNSVWASALSLSLSVLQTQAAECRLELLLGDSIASVTKEYGLNVLPPNTDDLFEMPVESKRFCPNGPFRDGYFVSEFVEDQLIKIDYRQPLNNNRLLEYAQKTYGETSSVRVDSLDLRDPITLFWSGGAGIILYSRELYAGKPVESIRYELADYPEIATDQQLLELELEQSDAEGRE